MSDFARLFGWWFEQRLWGGSAALSVYGYVINSPFKVRDPTGLIHVPNRLSGITSTLGGVMPDRMCGGIVFVAGRLLLWFGSPACTAGRGMDRGEELSLTLSGVLQCACCGD